MGVAAASIAEVAEAAVEVTSAAASAVVHGTKLMGDGQTAITTTTTETKITTTITCG